MTDQTLLEKLKQKEESAYRELYDIYYQQVINTSMGFLHCRHDAEDITQEVFIEVFNSVSKFRNESSLSTWLYRITVNKSLNHLRKHKKKIFV